MEQAQLETDIVATPDYLDVGMEKGSRYDNEGELVDKDV